MTKHEIAPMTVPMIYALRFPNFFCMGTASAVPMSDPAIAMTRMAVVIPPCSVICILSFAVLLIAIRKNNAADISLEKQPELLSFYIKLADEQIAEASRKSYNCMIKDNYDSNTANAVSLTIEECCLLLKNADKRRKNICAYIRLVFSDNKLFVTIFSDGAAVNILELTENITSKEMLSELIIKSKTDFINYQRIIEMNYVKLCVKKEKEK